MNNNFRILKLYTYASAYRSSVLAYFRIVLVSDSPTRGITGAPVAAMRALCIPLGMRFFVNLGKTILNRVMVGYATLRVDNKWNGAFRCHPLHRS